MTEWFDRAVQFSLRWEGGYVNDPDDPGGETVYGISRRAHPDWPGWKVIDAAKAQHAAFTVPASVRSDALELYHRRYWKPIKGDSLPPAIGLATFDYAVNSGASRAGRALQRVCGASIDGLVGPQTIKRVGAAAEAQGSSKVALEIVLQRVQFLTGLVKREPARAKYLHGWMRRTHAVAFEIAW